MTISSVTPSSLLAMLQQVSNATTSSGNSGTSGGIGGQLLAAIEQMQTNSGTTQDPLLNNDVTLSSGAALSNTSSSATYNAQGLLGQVQSAMMLNDPLLQSAGASVADPSNTMSGAIDASTTGAVANTGSSASDASNASLAQTFKNDPALVSVYVQTQLSQGVLGMFS